MGGMVLLAKGGCSAGGESKKHQDNQPQQLLGHTEDFGDTQGVGFT